MTARDGLADVGFVGIVARCERGPGDADLNAVVRARAGDGDVAVEEAVIVRDTMTGVSLIAVIAAGALAGLRLVSADLAAMIAMLAWALACAMAAWPHS